MGENTSPKEPCVVSAICEICGRMQIDTIYYQKDGNAATKLIVCDKCKKKK